MSGFTPGPWRVVYYDCGDRAYRDHNGPCPSIDAEGQDACVVHWDGFKQEYWSSANGDQRQIEANARLIAAAPDMLEALTDCLGWHDFADDLHKPIEVRAAYMRARAAISKATGEAP